MSPKIIDKAAKKQEILNAALIVFAQKGITNAKMVDVAEAAGIGKGTIYEYFKNKEEIFQAGYDHFMQIMETRTAQSLSRIYDPLEKIEALIECWTNMLQDDLFEFIQIWMDFWAEGVRSTSNKALIDLKKMYVQYRALIVKILDEGIEKGKIKPINTSIAASLLIGTLDGVMLQYIMDRDFLDLNEVVETIKQLYIKSLRCEE